MRKTISICGSMSFQQEMRALADKLRQRGHVVFEPADEESKVDYCDLSEGELVRIKGAFIGEHLLKIQRSDAVVLANYPKNNTAGYIGANTLIEAAFAFALGKKIYVLHSLEKQSCEPEILGLGGVVINGDLSRLD